MGLFSKLLGKDQTKNAATTAAAPPVACPHTILLPHWDNIGDMGDEEKATSFVCQSCGVTFSKPEADALRKTESTRLPT